MSHLPNVTSPGVPSPVSVDTVSVAKLSQLNTGSFTGSTLFAQPSLANFSWVNQGSSTASESGGIINVSIPASPTPNLRCLVRTIPAAPYTLTACIRGLLGTENFAQFGITLRQSSDGKLVTYGVTETGLQIAAKWNSPTSFNANYATTTFRAWNQSYVWLRCLDDNINRILSVSVDGVTFLPGLTITRTDFLTPDQIGFFGNSENNVPMVMGLMSWLTSNP